MTLRASTRQKNIVASSIAILKTVNNVKGFHGSKLFDNIKSNAIFCKERAKTLYRFPRARQEPHGCNPTYQTSENMYRHRYIQPQPLLNRGFQPHQ